MRHILCYLLVLCSLAAHGITFKSFNSRINEYLGDISLVVCDSLGFMWIGTNSELYRYDGYRFLPFTGYVNGKSQSFPGSHLALSEGRHIYIATSNELFKIDIKDYTVEKIPLLGHNRVRAITSGASGNIWVGTTTGLLCLSDAGTRIIDNTNSNISSNTIRSLYEDSSENLWVGTYNDLNMLPKGQDHFVHFDFGMHKKGDYPEKNLILSIIPAQADSDTTLFIGTETGLVLFNRIDYTYEIFTTKNTTLSNNTIKTAILKDGELWLGTDFGLNIFNPVDKKNVGYFQDIHHRNSLSGNVVTQICEVNPGMIWIMTNGGVDYVNSIEDGLELTSMTHDYLSSVMNNRVNAILPVSKEMLYLATQYGVICVRRRDGRWIEDEKVSHRINRCLHHNKNCSAIIQDAFGRLWIGTSAGVVVFDPKSGRSLTLYDKRSKIKPDFISSIVNSGDGRIVISSWGPHGGIYVVKDCFTNAEDIEIIKLSHITTGRIAVSNGNVWIAKRNCLLSVPLEGRHLEDTVKIIDEQDKIYDIYAKGANVILGTKEGVGCYNVITGRYTRTQTPLAPIINVTTDCDGEIWVSSKEAIFKISQDGTEKKIFPINPDHLEGLISPGITISDDGQIFCSAIGGFVDIDKEAIRPMADVQRKQRPRITSIAINNVDILPWSRQWQRVYDARRQEIVLSYRERNVTLWFSSLNMLSPQAESYRYRMVGFDEDWIYVDGKRNFAIYSNLFPGSYRFQVEVRNTDGSYHGVPSELSIKVKPPLLLSPLFIVFYLLIAVSGTYYIISTYIKRVKLSGELRLAQLEKQHEQQITAAKMDFFTNISHELRAPLTLIIPTVKSLMQNKELDSENRQLAFVAYDNCKRLMRLINQLLDFRKKGENELKLELSRVDIVLLTRSIFNNFAGSALENNIDYRFETNRENLEIMIDKSKYESIVFNLLSNAFKFTSRGDKIVLTLCADELDQRLALTVYDSGIGIAPEELDRIFTNFYRTKRGKEKNSGSGIGLSLVSSFVKLFDGEISVSSEMDKFSEFTVKIPIASMTKKSLLPQYNPSRFQGMKILCVDDDPQVLEMLNRTLGFRYSLLFAADGRQGMRKAQEGNPDLIITDLMMPDMDGIAMATQLKEDRLTKHIPIIIFTAKDMAEDHLRCIRIGVDSYITKPVEMELLEAQIEHILSRKTQMNDYMHNLILATSSDVKFCDHNEQFIERIIEVVEKNISDPDFHVDSLSRQIGISTTHLYRKIKQLTGMTTNDFIKKYRIIKASILLSDNKCDISEIMYYVGFTSPSYFSKCFKSEIGQTPSEFQRKNRRDV